ncbi:MAG: RecQ family zinc-binding domain-containing protein, partial [archaeon]|nr:RecQ family zinc-binding domain-containing protein [archaeon]
QESGRAGRDQLPADVALFYDPADISSVASFRVSSSGRADRVVQNLSAVRSYTLHQECRRKFISRYFEDESPLLPKPEHCCDNCQRPSILPPRNFTLETRILLRSIDLL